MKLRSAVLALALGGASLTGCGEGSGSGSGSSPEPSRTVTVEMVDTAFVPESIRVKRGETIRFVFANEGRVTHDAFIGDRQAQKDHEDGEHSSGHGHGSDAEDAVTVKPGETGELIYTFDSPKTLEIGCHEPGHYEAGMKIEITVV